VHLVQQLVDRLAEQAPREEVVGNSACRGTTPGDLAPPGDASAYGLARRACGQVRDVRRAYTRRAGTGATA